jgi:parvulin-like peptidyl-prolyl isomerase
MAKRILLIVLLLAAGGLAWYWTHYRLPDDVIARVDGVDIPVAAVDALVVVAQRQKPDVDRRAMLDGVIENRLFADYAEHHHDDHHDGGSGTVDYSPQTLYENELFKVLRVAFSQQINAAAEAAKSSGPMDFLEGELNLEPEVLKPMLALDSMLYHQMNEEQETAARQFVLGRYRFPGGDAHDLTLWDLYSRQNIQLKVQMHELNLPFMKQAVKQFLATQFVLDWFRRNSDFSSDEVAALEMLVSDRMAKEELLHDMGVMHDIHDDNPRLREIMAEVTADEVRQYYDTHKEEFTRVEKVLARHIRLPSQAQADEVAGRLRAGTLTFEEAIETYSLAPDKDAETPGLLGWIDRDDRHTNWVRGLAFVQPKGTPSPAFRSPQNDGEVYWEIILLDEKVMGYQPPDSEGVRYEASKAIAREKLQQQYVVLRDSLRDDACIRINESLLEPAS